MFLWVATVSQHTGKWLPWHGNIRDKKAEAIKFSGCFVVGAENFGQGEAFAYVYNHDDPYLSEFGYIGIKLGAAAGLVRTW